MADALPRRPNGNALQRAQARSATRRALARISSFTPRPADRLLAGATAPGGDHDVGLTLIRKSDPARPEARSEGRGGAGGRCDFGRRLQGGRAEGAERLPDRPQDHGSRHLRGPLGGLDPGDLARERHHARRDDQGAARHQQPPRSAPADRFLPAQPLGIRLPARQIRLRPVHLSAEHRPRFRDGPAGPAGRGRPRGARVPARAHVYAPRSAGDASVRSTSRPSARCRR